MSVEIYKSPNSFDKSKRIDDYQYLEREDLTNFVFPDNITEIGERAFFMCKNLKTIVLPDTLEYIGPSAFSGCENLEEIVIPNGIKKLGYRSFADCKRLKKVILPDTIDAIEWGVFAGCENLSEIVLPDSIKKLGEQVFLNCKKLKKVTLPKNIYSLPNEFFKGCKKLDIKLDSNIKKIGDSCFEGCSSLSTYPSHVENIGINCFKNCKSLDNIELNEKITIIPKGCFNGCTSLSNITSPNKTVRLGNKSFKNCKSLTKIPKFIHYFDRESAFENCIGLTSIKFDHDVQIGNACFRGCKNLSTIINQEKIKYIGPYAFSGCSSLKQFDIYDAVYVESETFSNCKNLKKVRIHKNIESIGKNAFANCPSLEDINLPDSIYEIKAKAFRNCKNIKKLRIPAELSRIGEGAFSYMDSLEYIEVADGNEYFSTPDNKILINNYRQAIVVYAIGLKDKSYSCKDYVISYNALGQEVIKPINGILEYAFAGAKNLNELTLCSCTKDIEYSAFYDCDNLKKLTVEAISLFPYPGFEIRKHSQYYFHNISKEKAYLPFEVVTFNGEIHGIYDSALKNFTNVKEINLPKNGSYAINSKAFEDCMELEKIDIPNAVYSIADDAFPDKYIEMNFENGIKTRELIELKYSNSYLHAYKLFVFPNGKYKIDQDGTITDLSDKQIKKICSKSEYILDNPMLFLDFMNDLINHNLDIKELQNGILFANCSLDDRKILFNNITRDDEFFKVFLEKSELLEDDDKVTKFLLNNGFFRYVINYKNTLEEYNITDPLLYDKKLISFYDTSALKIMISKHYNTFCRILKESKLLECDNNSILDNYSKDHTESNNSVIRILESNALGNFVGYLDKYNVKDRYLMQPCFIEVANNPLFEKLINVYDANIKRLLKLSLVTKNDKSSRDNINDLLTLLFITGSLEKDSLTRQKASTFICEKMFEEILPNNEKNENRIVGDDIHRIFNFHSLIGVFNPEFAEFFLENYSELVKSEKEKAGFIERVYLNFREISKTATSDKGSQRKLKVTIEKCKNYLANIKFDGVTEEYQDLANLIGKWYDENNAWLNAKKIYEESLSAPRNIFTKVKVDKNGNKNYDMNPKSDLKEEINPLFSYEWLPKQDYDNLILGKYCNCCAHVNGAGSGIMRASMILDCCQNLVIRNGEGEIVAKSTLYVNKEESYAVFNNVETSLEYRDIDSLENIYNAFIRGSIAFFGKYNKNNPTNPLSNITIGTNRNTVLRFLNSDEKHHPKVDINKSLEFGSYAVYPSRYNGDWQSEQVLVLKK